MSAGTNPPVVRFAVEHRTSYRYSQPMADGYTVAYLLPRDTPQQRVVTAEVAVDPAPDEREELADHFGNRVLRMGIHAAHDHLEVTARSLVDVMAPPPVPATSVPWDDRGGAHPAGGRDAIAVDPFLAHTATTPALPLLAELTAPVFVAGRPLVDVVRALSSLIHREFQFDNEFTDVSTPLDVVVAERRGVCQDFAHLAIACLRSRGVAARYVSGYLETAPAPGQPKLTGSDASHAWCSAWVPGTGWLDLDPTNDQVPPQRHITVAWGRDYFDVTPVRGVVVGPVATQTLHVGVDVRAVVGTSTGVSETR